tara:strand:- start:553 stop:1536 length:984 start_codon:yes stop_codon:yes gene_type:complete
MIKNIAVVGCGHWGKNLIRNFSELGVLYAVCDENKELADKFADLYKVDNLNFNEIINNESIQGVVIAAPAVLHAQLAIKALSAKKHVYVEKPLSLNIHDSNEMIKTSLDNDVQLMVGHLLQYHPIFIKLLELVNLGKFGNILSISSNRMSFGKVRSEEDVIWSFAPHDISMILALAQRTPSSVIAESSYLLRKNVADSAKIYLKFGNSFNADISVSWINPFKEHKLVLVGELGMAVFDDTLDWEKKLAITNYDLNQNDSGITIEKSESNYIKVNQSEPLKNECAHFVEVVNEKKMPRTNASEGLEVVKVLSAASLSAKNNIYVEIEK